MLAKRIIPCLDVKNGETVKGVNFENLRSAGDPVELAKRYSDCGADELVFLDITATNEARKTTVKMVEAVAKQVFIPFTVGGGIKSVDDMKILLQAGADKIAINSAAVKNPQFVKEASDYFGSQCVVVAIDAKFVDNDYFVFINAGTKNTGIKLSDWCKQVEELGAGEILLTSMDADGTQNGFDIEMTKLVSTSVGIPVIASGGAGADSQHFVDVFKDAKADAALAASIFHFGMLPVPKLKQKLIEQNICVREVENA
ncbi:MAG: imidazole glycerol phosphate synthase subunit HisF [Candidatus Gastranaerophilales bacterium]|nr:imidazole glycerol phosphate synthase subunit HisF [Candidatus Gastranaerophilales bacterium]